MSLFRTLSLFLLTFSCSLAVSCRCFKHETLPATVQPPKDVPGQKPEPLPEIKPSPPEEATHVLPKQPSVPHAEPAPMPLTPHDKPLQISFPYGSTPGPLFLHDDFLIRTVSWENDGAVQFIDLANPKTKIICSLPVGCRIRSIEKKEDHLYLAAGQSILIISLPQRNNGMIKLPYILERLLICPGNDKISKICISGNSLFVAAPDGLRIYNILNNGRLAFSATVDLPGITVFSVSGNNVFYVSKQSGNVIRQIHFAGSVFSDGSVTLMKAAVDDIWPDKNGKLLVRCGRKLLNRNSIQIINGNCSNIIPVAGNKAALVLDGPDNRQFISVTDGKMTERIPVISNHLRHIAILGKQIVWEDDDGLFLQRGQGDAVRLFTAVLPAPVISCHDTAYSIDRSEKIYRFYGFRIDLKQNRFILNDPLEWNRLPPKAEPCSWFVLPLSVLQFQNWIFAPQALISMMVPQKPELVAAIDAPAFSSVADEQGRIFLAQGSKLTVFDGKQLPRLVRLAEIPGRFFEITVSGRFLYSMLEDRLQVFDLKRIDEPRFIAELTIPGKSVKFCKFGNLLFCAPFGAGTPFRIIDISAPHRPSIAALISGFTGHRIDSLTIHNDKLYCADGAKIFCFSLKNPLRPVIEKTWFSPDDLLDPYVGINVRNGVLVGRKYGSWNAWRIGE